MKHEELSLVFGFHYLGIFLFAIVGTIIVNRLLSQNALLSLWMLFGAALSALIFLLQSSNLLQLYLLSFSLGASVGFGFPSCLAYFSDRVDVSFRGRAGGVIMFAAFIGVFVMGFITSAVGFMEAVLVLTLWRGIGLVVFHAFKKKKKEAKEFVDINYKSILSEKSFAFYIIPWIMFSLVNFFGYPLQQYFWGVETSNMIVVAEFGIGSVASLISGYFADIIGRKRLVILGYVLLGIGYAMLSILPTSQISISIYMLFDGIAWGIFALIFFLVIWGDLAENKVKDKYYLLGEMPFLIASYISVIVAPYVKAISISAAFSMASFFLFLAVLPLMYAPETLPEKKIRERELKDYIEKAKKIREKHP
jgi:predicted MFS family arabinose efflux permease